MRDLILLRGPEGRPAKHSPARKGWESMEGDAERRRCGTRLSRLEAVEAHCIVAKNCLFSAAP
jgi:hypothetical protein